LRIEELEAMKFGKKRNNLKNIANILPSGKPDKKLIKRAPESYRRAEPKASEITDEVVFNIKKCLECGENLTDKKEYIHYREDLKTSQEQLKLNILHFSKTRKCRWIITKRSERFVKL